MSPSAIWAAVCALLVIIAAYVALAITGNDTAGLVNALVTLAGVTGLAAHIERRTQQQNQTINKIDRQTNGVLDTRIREGTKAAVAAVLAEHGVVTPPPAKRPARKAPARKTSK